MKMPAVRVSIAAVAVALLALGSLGPEAFAQGNKGPNVLIRLRLAGDAAILPPVRSCLADKLSQMPDVKVATVPTEGVRFVVDTVVMKSADDTIFASLVVAETFPMEQFRPRIKEGQDAEALLKSIRYYTLLRLHELVGARSDEDLCLHIASDIGDKVLSKEYTERND
jgi:hypothetical protein